MNSRKYIFILGLVILFSISFITMLTLVNAINVGQILTQSQIDNINFETVNLNCTHLGSYISIPSLSINSRFNCLSLKPVTNTTNYEVINQGAIESVPLINYISCRNKYSKQVCLNYIRDITLTKFREDKIRLRKLLMKYQSDYGNNDLLNGDLIFGDGDLN